MSLGSFVVDTENVIHVGDGISFPPFFTGNIGIPVSRVTKLIHPETRQRALLIEIDYTHVEQNDAMPKVRIIPSILQGVEPYDSEVQYLVYSAPRYQTLAFRVTNIEVDCRWESFNWETKKYKSEIYFRGPNAEPLYPPQSGVPQGPAPNHVMGPLLPPH